MRKLILLFITLISTAVLSQSYNVTVARSECKKIFHPRYCERETVLQTVFQYSTEVKACMEKKLPMNSCMNIDLLKALKENPVPVSKCLDYSTLFTQLPDFFCYGGEIAEAFGQYPGLIKKCFENNGSSGFCTKVRNMEAYNRNPEAVGLCLRNAHRFPSEFTMYECSTNLFEIFANFGDTIEQCIEKVKTRKFCKDPQKLEIMKLNGEAFFGCIRMTQANVELNFSEDVCFNEHVLNCYSKHPDDILSFLMCDYMSIRNILNSDYGGFERLRRYHDSLERSTVSEELSPSQERPESRAADQ